MPQAPEGNFVWGTLALSFVQTKRYEITPVTDPSGLDVVAAKHTITVSGILTSGLPPARPGESASAILRRIKTDALRHRRYLKYAPVGEEILEIGDKLEPTNPEKNFDIVGGPKCIRCDVSDIAEMCISVDLTIEAVIVPCNTLSSEQPRAILSSRWEESESFDQLGYCTLARRGTMMLRYNHGKTLDEILEEAKLPRVRLGYQEQDGSELTPSPDGLTLTWSRTEKEFEVGPPPEALRCKVHATLSSKPGQSILTLSIEMDAPAARDRKAGNEVPDNRWMAMLRRLRDIVQSHRMRYSQSSKEEAKGELPALLSQSLTVDEMTYSLKYQCTMFADPVRWMMTKVGLPYDGTLDQFVPFSRPRNVRIQHNPPRVNASAAGYTFTIPPAQEPCGKLSVSGELSTPVSPTLDGGELTGGNGVSPGDILTGGDYGGGGDWGPTIDSGGDYGGGGDWGPTTGNNPDYQPGGKYGASDGPYQFPQYLGTEPPQVFSVPNRDGTESKVLIPARDASAVYGLAPRSEIETFGTSSAEASFGAAGSALNVNAIDTDPENDVPNDGVGVAPTEDEPTQDTEDDGPMYTHYIVMWDHMEETGRHVAPTANFITRAGHPYQSHSGQVKLTCRWTCERTGALPHIPDWEPPQQSLGDQPTEKVIVGKDGKERTYKLTQHASNYVLTNKRITTESKQRGASGELIHVISGQYDYDVIDPDRAIIMHGYRPDILKEVKSVMGDSSSGLVPDHYPRAADVIWWGLSSGPGQHEFRLRKPPSSTSPNDPTSQSNFV
jgi:hypothetical protein